METTNSMSNTTLAANLCQFIDSSPTPYHAVQQMMQRFKAAGFVELRETESWELQPKMGYLVTRNDSSILAFTTGDQGSVESGIPMVGAHTDSPCLKIKPNPDLKRQQVSQLGVEVYGGVLFNPWFDRDLSLAGRVSYADKNGQLQDCLVNFEKPIAKIPSLAIHLDRDANTGRTVNAQKHLPLVLAGAGQSSYTNFRTLLKEKLDETLGDKQTAEKLYSYEIYVYDTQPAAIIGLNDEYLSAARLDNLMSCYCATTAMLKAFERQPERPQLLICTDHEEIGSQSACGAQGPLLKDIIERLIPDAEKRQQAIRKSIFISADNAHAVHPNYADLHDENHGPKINGGPVIKVNANQRYATNSENSAVFRQICDQENIPVQEFVVRTDLACGSTIGPITAANIGISTIDIGCPQWAMHSIRETAGTADIGHMVKALTAFYGRALPAFN